MNAFNSVPVNLYQHRFKIMQYFFVPLTLDRFIKPLTAEDGAH